MCGAHETPADACDDECQDAIAGRKVRRVPNPAGIPRGREQDDERPVEHAHEEIPHLDKSGRVSRPDSDAGPVSLGIRRLTASGLSLP